ncbi:MAG TPA: YccF domain-containing protein [Anaerolineales bacterium]|nr:YccF domain-containing protein [Anaerolineales bacterium]
MSILGNIIWMIFGGFVAGMGYILGGLLVCLTIVGIPFGVQAIKLGLATMTPFGRKIVPNDAAAEPVPLILNIAWAILFGWEIAVAHLVHGLILYITIIGIPFGQQHFKLIPLALAPFGRELR